MVSANFPHIKSNLPAESQPWGRAVEAIINEILTRIAILESRVK